MVPTMQTECCDSSTTTQMDDWMVPSWMILLLAAVGVTLIFIDRAVVRSRKRRRDALRPGRIKPHWVVVGGILVVLAFVSLLAAH